MIRLSGINSFSLFVRFAVLLSTLTISVFPQTRTEVLATSKLRPFTTADLTPDVRKAYQDQKQDTARLRVSLLSQLIAERLLEAEAKSTGTTVESLLESARNKAAKPGEKQITEFFNANQSLLSGATLDESRSQIAEFLSAQNEQGKITELIERLRQKYKVSITKDINSPLLRPADVIARIGSISISAADFDAKYRIFLNDELHFRYEDVRADLVAAILSALIEQESIRRGMDPSDLIASEVTNKLRDFSNGEREVLENDLKERLFAEYSVKILLKEPPIIRQNVSLSDAYSTGPATAPISVVMFSDFECPACAATHPILKQLLDQYKSRIRLVIRNFPLQERHPHSMAAAIAAAAAGRQGKFFEYVELLYANQARLDDESLFSYAERLGLDIVKFRSDMADPQIRSRIEKDIDDGIGYGVNSTPTIFVNGAKVHRLAPEAFRRAIERELSPRPPSASKPVRRR